MVHLTPHSSLDLTLNEDQCAIADAIDRFCESRCDTHTVKGLTDTFSSPLWRELAEMGVLSAATPDGDGGALEICAISEALGRHVFPGPVAATFLATQVLDHEERLAVMSGLLIVSLGNLDNKNNHKPVLMPFAEPAHIFLLTDGKTIYRAEPTGKTIVVKTLGGEPWGRVDLKVGTTLANSERGLILNDVSTAAYLVAAAKRLVKDASDYANVRKQFGKTLGEFQGVAHPLADCQISLTAAESLARAAACCFDQHDFTTAKEYSAAARLSASRAALKSAYVCHQVFAGIGITLEGPAFHITRRIRQLVSQAPGDKTAQETLLKQITLGA
jgi:alkylation response protein AidB-like acyl-CoA dehydrogenase